MAKNRESANLNSPFLLRRCVCLYLTYNSFLYFSPRLRLRGFYLHQCTDEGMQGCVFFFLQKIPGVLFVNIVV